MGNSLKYLGALLQESKSFGYIRSFGQNANAVSGTGQTANEWTLFRQILRTKEKQSCFMVVLQCVGND